MFAEFSLVGLPVPIFPNVRITLARSEALATPSIGRLFPPLCPPSKLKTLVRVSFRRRAGTGSNAVFPLCFLLLMSSTGALNAGGWFGCEGPCVTWTTASPIAACFCVVSLSDLHLHSYSNETLPHCGPWCIVRNAVCSQVSPQMSVNPRGYLKRGWLGRKYWPGQKCRENSSAVLCMLRKAGTVPISFKIQQSLKHCRSRVTVRIEGSAGQ